MVVMLAVAGAGLGPAGVAAAADGGNGGVTAGVVVLPTSSASPTASPGPSPSPSPGSGGPSGPAEPSGPAAPSGPGGTVTGPLPNTGADVTGRVSAGLLLLAAGVLLVQGARRRRSER